MKYPASDKRKCGFALVVTLALMILLTVIAVGLLSLSSISLRASAQGEAQAAARANARMALVLAVGQLQKNAGLDQRVTATASILDTDGQLANPNWTGVWRADGLKTDPIPVPATASVKGLIYREPSSRISGASLKDRRASSSGGYKRDEQVLEWLVSNPNPGTPLSPSPALGETDRVTLVDDGSARAGKAFAGSRYKVHAPLVKVNQPGANDGAIAWAVLDEGVKARYDLANPKKGPAAENPWRSAARVGVAYARDGVSSKAVMTKHPTLDEDQIAKVASKRGIELAEDLGTSNADDLKAHFHDVTVGTYSVLADTQNGGLKRDMSQFLQTGSSPALGSRKALALQTPIFDVKGLRLISPTWGVLRSWYEKSEKLTASGTATLTPNSATILSGAAELWYPGNSRKHSSSAPSIKQRTVMGIHPVVVDAGVSYGASLLRLPDAPTSPNRSWYRLRMHYSPRVVLFNPYDVRLRAADYAISFEMPHVFSYSIVGVSSKTSVSMDLNGRFRSILSDGNNLPHRPIFSMSGVTLEPGEAVLFTANGSGHANRAIPWPKATDGASLTSIGGVFELSANNPLPLVDSFYFDCEGDDAKFEMSADEARTATYRVLSSKDGSGEGGWKSYMFLFSMVNGSKGPGSVSNMRVGATGFEALQYFHMTEDGVHGSDAPWVPNGNLPASVGSPLKETSDAALKYPYYRSKWGKRWIWMDETPANQSYRIGPYNPPFVAYNQLATQNIGATWVVRSPIENCMRASAAGGRYTHGSWIDDPVEWYWEDALLSPVSVKGKNRVSPFGYPGRSGGGVYPLLAVPRGGDDVVSLASLQHVPLSIFPWHPSFAMGNSLADPRCARNKTTNYLAKDNWGMKGTGIGIHSGKNQSGFRMAHLDANLNDEAFLYDLSYETNFALWDSYFLSTVPQQSDWSFDVPLANPRLVPCPSASVLSVNSARDHHKAATQFMLAGGFNVNSTSVPAWAAVLASMSASTDLEIALGDGSKVKANHVFSHLLRPAGNPSARGATDPYNPSFWTDFRKLTDNQIYELAEQVVVEVKRRGPFISVADFVNRRLVDPPASSGAETDFTRTGLKGALQAAIDRTSINDALLKTFVIAKTEYDMGSGEQIQYGTSYPKLEYPLKNGSDGFGLKPDHNHWADSKLVQTPAFLTQADVLQKIGQTLTARSDTFVVRAYGDSRDVNGRIVARAWCEAVVQRTPSPVEGVAVDDTGLNPGPKSQFGRVFRVVAFRWLTSLEV